MRPEQEALVGIALCAMVSDGVIDQAEALDLEDLLATHPALGDVSERDLRAAMGRVDAEARQLGERAYLAKCAAAIPPGARHDAYVLAAELVASDEHVEVEEGTFLDRLRKGLGLSVDEAARVLADARARVGS